MKEKPCYVYLVAHRGDDGLRGPIKVGITSSIKARISALQTGSARPIAIQAVIMLPTRKLARALEGVMHEMLAEDGLHGEWFNVGPIYAAGLLASMTHMLLEHAGVPEGRFYDALDATGATVLMRRFEEEYARENLQ